MEPPAGRLDSTENREVWTAGSPPYPLEEGGLPEYGTPVTAVSRMAPQVAPSETGAYMRTGDRIAARIVAALRHVEAGERRPSCLRPTSSAARLGAPCGRFGMTCTWGCSRPLASRTFARHSDAAMNSRCWCRMPWSARARLVQRGTRMQRAGMFSGEEPRRTQIFRCARGHRRSGRWHPRPWSRPGSRVRQTTPAGGLRAEASCAGPHTVARSAAGRRPIFEHPRQEGRAVLTRVRTRRAVRRDRRV